MTTRHDGTIIYTPFPDYEVEDPLIGANTVRTTYRVAGQMVALRVKDGTSDKRYYTYTDHLGNVVALSEGSSFVSGSLARYDPFGNYRTTPATTTNPAITNHGFTGHRHNNTGVYPTQNVGLIYMNARYYLPEVGRFISPDTIVPNPSNPQSYNRYSYVLNSPLNLTDPTGHRECGAKEDCSDPLPHEISQPSSSPVKPQPIQMEEWEKQLLAITAFVEMHRHGTDQAIAIMWVVLNRITGGTTVTGETFHPNTNFSSISKLASYVFCQGQFAIGNVIMGEYKLLEIGNNGDFQLADDLTLQDVVAQGYTRLNTHYNGAVDLILNDVVNPVMAAFNGGENDPTKGSVYYGHLTPDQRSLSIGRLQQYAQVLNVTNQVEYVLIPSSQTNDLGEPVNYLIVNNLMALP